MCKVQMLRALVEQRLTAAAEEIFGLFERTIAEYEEELCRSKEENERQRELLDAVFNPQLRVHRAVTMQPAGRRSLRTSASSKQTLVDAISVECRQEPEPPPHIKEEQEEGPMYRHIDQLPFTLVSGASEYGDYEEVTVQPAGRRSLRTSASSTQTPALPPDNKSQIVIKEEQQECSCSVDQQEPELPPRIKEEQEELWSSQEEGPMYRHIDQIPFTLVSRASEYGDYEEDVEQLVEEDIPAEQQDCSSSVDQEEPESPPHIKEEQEELWSSQEGEQLQGLEEADITKFPFPPVPVKSEDDEEEAQSSQLHQRQTQHMETEADREDCGGPEPARNSHLLLQPETEDQTRHSSEPETDDSADWKETREPQSALNSLKHDSRYKKNFSCSECGRRFGRRTHLKTHMRTHSVEKPFSCSICKNFFRHSGALWSHMAVHTGEKRFSCSVCNKIFAWRSDVEIHKCVGQMKTEAEGEDCGGPEPARNTHLLLQPETGDQTGDSSKPETDDRADWKETREPQSALKSLKDDPECKKPFSCSECGRRFGTPTHLKRHMGTHTGEKPFSCSVCKKSFTQKGSLQKHSTIHTGEKSFSCSVCKISFTQRGSLRSHMVVHTGEKRFSCSVCNRRFSWSSDVERHKCVGPMETEADGEDCGAGLHDYGQNDNHDYFDQY